MKYALLSDSHDNLTNLQGAIRIAKGLKPKALIFLGDFSTSASFDCLSQAGLPLYFVFGNVESEVEKIVNKAKLMDNIRFGMEILEFRLDQRNIAICHKPERAYELAFSKNYDAVFHGHTHKAKSEMVGNTLLANPGEIFGRLGNPSLGIYDSAENSIKIIKF
ncbi:MAG: YfcE family phosphodiesterase [Candidatus Micrarchaeota archaeon]|nr:YfcE family phosphodiesterase [Candidatus Micrarchaeota archaeon]MDE1864334.1 YfcE family phosphodiesterase [Candidatus Micrarchaeota archaeon]